VCSICSSLTGVPLVTRNVSEKQLRWSNIALRVRSGGFLDCSQIADGWLKQT
jgi:hypothetical protein